MGKAETRVLIKMHAGNRRMSDMAPLLQIGKANVQNGKNARTR